MRKWVSEFGPTHRVYLEDSYVKELYTNIQGVLRERGNKYYLVLHGTIFHPKAGGQSNDTGFIDNDSLLFKVEKVLQIGDVIVHYGKLLKGELLQGMRVRLVLDWGKRYRNMRLHTAGHILDYAVKTVYGRVVETIEAYHSPPEPYIVYDAEAPSPDLVKEIEGIANNVVSSNIPVKIVNVNRDELDAVVFNAPNLRRLPVASNYRVVVIEGINAIPCTGTHVKYTGEVGKVVIKRVVDLKDKFKLIYDIE